MTVATAERCKTQNVRLYLVLGLLVLFLLSAIIASSGEMGGVEATVFHWIYNAPSYLRWFALLATQLGSAWIALGIVGVLFVVRKNPYLALVVIRGGLITYVVIEITKVLVSRPRPMELLEGVVSGEVAVYGHGFPSGHTALATVLGLILLPYLPKNMRWIIFVWILLVGWSRIYLGVHAPLDIVGGTLVGVLVFILADRLPWPKSSRAKS